MGTGSPADARCVLDEVQPDEHVLVLKDPEATSSAFRADLDGWVANGCALRCRAGREAGRWVDTIQRMGGGGGVASGP